MYLAVQFTLSVSGQFRGQKKLGPFENTERCRLSLLTNSALVYEPKCVERGDGGGGGCGVSANEYSFAHGAQINFFEDLTPYLTYGKISGKQNGRLCVLPASKITSRTFRISSTILLKDFFLYKVMFLMCLLLFYYIIIYNRPYKTAEHFTFRYKIPNVRTYLQYLLKFIWEKGTMSKRWTSFYVL